MANEKRLIAENDIYALFGQNGRAMLHVGDIDVLPRVDAVEVVHGRWVHYSTTTQECSNCKRHTARHKFKYCPHCGAIMEDKYNG